MPLAVVALTTACTHRSSDSSDTATSSAPAGCSSAKHSPGDPLPADFTPIPGTHLALRVPDGMQVDASLPGLVRPKTNTTIVVVDQQQPAGQQPDKTLAKMEDTFRKSAGPGQQGLKLDAPKRTEIAGFPASIVTGTQEAKEGSFRKALAAIAPPDSFVTLTGTAEQKDPLTDQQLLATFCDARWLTERAPAELGFTITPSGDYKEVPSGGSLMFSLRGETGPDVPIFLAAPSQGQSPVPAAERRAFAERRFRGLPGNPQVQTVEDATVAGDPAVEIVGSSPAASNYSMMVFTDTGYILLSGVARNDAPDQTPAFREMAQSLRLQ
ncbi:hypothetical protein Mycch_1272 [Mycolicibacterium chubuense NBB4]|uniref:Uncharacterized protein n=1 Tax=Mycolicibacterium chubuense (strain NBB4) TaxID=710421 RepID=I4BFM3_MYCCN|nr:hypothetical protein Mycch_1272 [Mycolicibacterium chubuense NBB4]